MSSQSKSNTTISCTRRIEFDAAHRVMQHESKCKYLHGHRYAIEATFEAKSSLDNLGRVVDFGVIKELLGGWVDDNWDHNTILHVDDKSLGEQIASELDQDIYYLPQNPTAENMAEYLISNICPQLFAEYDITCTIIRLYETPNCYAEVVA